MINRHDPRLFLVAILATVLAILFGDPVMKATGEVKFFVYRKAAEQGFVRAQYNLGICYHNGTGVVKDGVEAVKWFRKAADKGNAEAQFMLGNRYRDGNDVAEDKVEAVKWFRKAAEQGLAQAQYNLGVCYHNGAGVVQDYVQAGRWYQEAADQGFAEAAKGLKLLNLQVIMEAATVTVAQIATGQKRANKLQKEIAAKTAEDANKAGK